MTDQPFDHERDLHGAAPGPGGPPPPVPGRLLDLIDEVIADVEQARTIPLSSNVRIDRDAVLAKLDRLRQELPEELRAARWMVREREAYIARTNEKARSLVARAREEAEALVAESSIVREAVEEANRLVRNAETEARTIRLEAEDYAEETLVTVETVLDERLREIRSARAYLHEARPAPPEAPVGE